MPCLCHKLLAKKYSKINKSEAQILRSTYEEAPHLFHDTQLTPPNINNPAVARQQKRSVPASSSVFRKSRRPSPVLGSPTPPAQPFNTPCSKSITLEKTYDHQKTRPLPTENDDLLVPEQHSIYVRIFVVLDKSDVLQRICCYVLAKLHQKGISVDFTAQEIRNALHKPLDLTKRQIYNILTKGNKWVSLLEVFASIANGRPDELLGFLGLFCSPSLWEEASDEDSRLALNNLCKDTDIIRRAKELTPAISKVLSSMNYHYHFVSERSAVTSNLPSVGPGSNLDQGRLTMAYCRSLDITSEAPSVWKIPLLHVASEVIFKPGVTFSHDAQLVLLLSSFLSTSEKIHRHLLLRGAACRGRWSEQGEIEEVGADCADDLSALLSDTQRVAHALYELNQASEVLEHFDQTYRMNEATAARIHAALSAEQRLFWKHQALVIVYRAIPWNYIESIEADSMLFLPHLRHVLQAMHGDFRHLSTSTRVDLALTLLEACRYPGMSWKRDIVDHARAIACDLQDRYLHYRIAEIECTLYRITGQMNRAFDIIQTVYLNHSADLVNKKAHSAAGKISIQCALNHIQIEDLAQAEQALDQWNPSVYGTSTLETVILVRKYMILGRIARFRGRFDQARGHLEQAQMIVNQRKELDFNKDLSDITCDLADTLRELDDPSSAEYHLRREIARQKQQGGHNGSLLELCLSETLFAQQRYDEAKPICLDVESRQPILKIEKLRLHITLAKLYHVTFDGAAALDHWSKAFAVVSKFVITNSFVKRTIIRSISDILSRQGSAPTLEHPPKQMDDVHVMAKPGEAKYWVAGLHHWSNYIRS
ncbi:hypothetical protein HD806DRAFT_504076 [Xylariaceae sp. AK1471]|nr:hypothetical protein HD806DRAFT_504076 [Xylariaceae sp. AK1471]